MNLDAALVPGLPWSLSSPSRAQAPKILVPSEECGGSAEQLPTVLGNLPLADLEVTSSPEFESQLASGSLWDLVIAYRHGPGGLTAPSGAALAASFEAAYASDLLAPEPLQRWVSPGCGSDHALFKFPNLVSGNAVPDADADGDGLGDECECGDPDGNGGNTVSDPIAINAAIFTRASTSRCARQPFADP